MSSHIKMFEVILFVRDQHMSSRFYQAIFHKAPDLEVPGMTEFQISEFCKVGLMPNANIARILGNNRLHPDSGTGIPRCELYLYVDDIQQEFENAIRNGAKLVSQIMDRNWGDMAGYISDPDGHIIAFAEKKNE